MINLDNFFRNFNLYDKETLFDIKSVTQIDYYNHNLLAIPKYINEYWTSKQRQSNSLHEVSYRACFKPQLPRFFIELLTNVDDIVYDPFSGRGTTALEASLLNRRFIANDINPLSLILLRPRVRPPKIDEIAQRLNEINFNQDHKQDIDLSMFYHEQTFKEILSLRCYLIEKKSNDKEDYIDHWIRMVATNRLTGHSKGFFSVYTLPPNQAVAPESQIKINTKKNQKPEYRNTKEIILRKSYELLKDVTDSVRKNLWAVAENSIFLNCDAANTNQIQSNSVSLTVTSPPFLDVVDYASDNWLRCWFNDLDVNDISKNLVMAKSLDKWIGFITNVFSQLYRITNANGFVAFEVGEVKNGRINLEEYVVDIGIKSGFTCAGIIINQQTFTKTSNIWGVKNNTKGTNSNRIVLFKK